MSIIALNCTAQDVVLKDKELGSLVDVVMVLRNPTETNINKAKQQLENDKQWTVMDELKDENHAECLLTRKMKRFNLVAIMNGVLANRYGKANVPGHYLNGEDTRFNYSLIEKGIKAKKTAKYTFRGRVGKQDFIFIPCNPQSANLSIRLTKGKKKLKSVQQTGKDGCIYLHTDAELKSTDEISLEIENKSDFNVAIAILNHNTRK